MTAALDTASPVKIAGAFVALLRRDLTPTQWAEMRERNATPDYAAGACASHDYCDANMIMLEACETLGVPTVLDFTDGEPDHEKACQVWNAAWEIAKRDYLTA